MNARMSHLLVSGMPASGKSSFCRYLAREHGFSHYDLECWPQGWPALELYPVWNASRPEFVKELNRRHRHWVLDWGFPPQFVGWVAELQAQGVQLIWFSAEVDKALALFEERGGQRLESFYTQVEAIAAAGYPATLSSVVVNTLDAAGHLRPMTEIYAQVFEKAA